MLQPFGLALLIWRTWRLVFLCCPRNRGLLEEVLVQDRHPLTGLGRLRAFLVSNMKDISYPFLIQVLVLKLLGVAAQITFELGFEARKDGKLAPNRHLLLVESLISDVLFIEL